MAAQISGLLNDWALYLKFYCAAGVHQMRLLRRHSLIIVINVVVIVGHLKSFQPQKQRFSSFKNNTEQTDGPTDGHDLL